MFPTFKKKLSSLSVSSRYILGPGLALCAGLVELRSKLRNPGQHDTATTVNELKAKAEKLSFFDVVVDETREVRVKAVTSHKYIHQEFYFLFEFYVNIIL